MNEKLNSQYKFLTIKDLLNLTGFSRSSINLKIANGSFPKPFYQTNNKRLWKESDYISWVKAMEDDMSYERFRETYYEENGE